jgi:hypothetical protein
VAKAAQQPALDVLAVTSRHFARANRVAQAKDAVGHDGRASADRGPKWRAVKDSGADPIQHLGQRGP